MFNFKISHQDKKTKARTAVLTTPHGAIHTPSFLAVGTQASIKSLSPEEVRGTNTEAILANTYHLYLRPGALVIAKLGGLHKYMGWKGPIMTDSAGFQVFSLGFGIEHEVGKMVSLYGEDLVLGDLSNPSTSLGAGLSHLGNLEKSLTTRTKLCKIEEEGPTFVSHLDGSVHFFPPEKSVETQIKLGADLIVALDECTSPLHNYDYTKAAMERTHRWEERALKHFKNSKVKNQSSKIQFKSQKSPHPNPLLIGEGMGEVRKQALFGVIQGGPFKDLRITSTKFVASRDFFGMGIGGALVSKSKMQEILDWIYPYLPDNRPRHLFGIGTVDDIFNAVERGVDMFDCVIPTRLGRMGHVLLKVSGKDTSGVTRRGSPEVEELRKSLLTKEQQYAYKADKFRLDITKSCFLNDSKPIDPECQCYTCKNFSRAYLCHLFRARELFSYRLATIHNLYFMQELMREIREGIEEDRFLQVKKEWL